MKLICWGCSALAGACAIFAGVTPAGSAAHAGSLLLGLSSLIVAATPTAMVYLRNWAADRKAERERRAHEVQMLNELMGIRGQIGEMKRVDRLKDQLIAELQSEVAENRAYQNETRSYIRPPLPPVPPGPVEQRLSDSGQYPPAPETSD